MFKTGKEAIFVLKTFGILKFSLSFGVRGYYTRYNGRVHLYSSLCGKFVVLKSEMNSMRESVVVTRWILFDTYKHDDHVTERQGHWATGDFKSEPRVRGWRALSARGRVHKGGGNLHRIVYQSSVMIGTRDSRPPSAPFHLFVCYQRPCTAQ